LDLNDFIAKAKTFFYALRHRQTEQVLATLVLAFFGGGAWLQQQLKQFPQASYLAYGLGTVSLIGLIYQMWKLATPPPEPPASPMPSAIKGLLPFTVADGKLFAHLGRNMELQQLLGLARDDRIAVSAIRGESGVGKTSLLQAGLAYALREEQCVYWEAVPEKAPDALLHAIRSLLPCVESLESLPDGCPKRCVLILDQFEQLRRSEPAHAPIFALVNRIARAPAPYKLSAIVGYRRDYADWPDIEEDYGFRAESVRVNSLARRTAGDALVTLAGEAGFTLDQALVENFILGVVGSQGVSPMDIAIGALSLANFIQQSGATHVGLKEYSLAGGAEGLLLSFVQQKLEEIPEAMRAPLLKGIVLALVNSSNNQRIAEGETAAAIAVKAEVPEGALVPWLERLAHPRVRLLEKVSTEVYRLPHERLVPVLRRLAGRTLASLDQRRLLFEGEYMRWWETRNRRHLLGRKDLTTVLRHRDQFMQGEAAAGKTEYLAACLRRRAIVRLALSGVVIAVAVAGYVAYRAWDSTVQQQKLASWYLPPELFKMQDAVDQMDIHWHPVNDLGWLRSGHIRKLNLAFGGTQFASLDKLKGLTSLTLTLKDDQVTSLSGLQRLKGLTSLSLDLNHDHFQDLADLAQLKGLTSLSLNLSGFRVLNIAELEQLVELEKLKGLTSLSLNLSNSTITSLEGLQQLKGLTSLSLNLSNSSVTSFEGLEQLTGLTSLSLNLNYSRVTSLAGLEQLKGLTTLSLNLSASNIKSLEGLQQLKGLRSLSLNLDASSVTSLVGLDEIKGLTSFSLQLLGYDPLSLTGLEQIKGLTSLSLILSNSKVTRLAELGQLKGITSLSLDLTNSQVTSLAGLEQLKGLTSLSLNLSSSRATVTTVIGLQDPNSLDPAAYSQIKSLAGLENLKGLTSLSLNLSNSLLTSLAGLEQLKGLTSISLDLSGSQVTNLSELEELKGLTSIELTLSAPLVSSFLPLKIRRDITELRIAVAANTPLDVPTGCKFVGLTAH
jgi:hypothetical protein